MVKLRCERETLLDALSTANRAVGRGQLPVLSGVLLELDGDQLTVTGSDLELTIRKSLLVNGEIDGRAVIPSKLLVDVVKSLEPGAVELEINELDATIRGGRSEFSLRTIPADDYPQLVQAEGAEVVIGAQDFATALNQVVSAASNDDSRPILTGVLFKPTETGLRLVATDSYRLAITDIEGASILEQDQSVLVPSRALDEVRRLIKDTSELALRLGSSEAAFSTPDLEVTTRLIDGDFPQVESLIPKNSSNELELDKDAMIDAVRRVGLLAQESSPVRMVMSSEGVDVVATTQDVGEAQERVDATYNGEDLTVAFNPTFLLDGFRISPGTVLKLATTDSLKPALLSSAEHPNFLYVLMPVRTP